MTRLRPGGALPLALIGWLAFVEITSGILQGYYVTITTEIARNLNINDADVNWFEAGNLLVSALVVPVLAKLGDMYGHKKILLISTAVTAGASWWMAFSGDFWSYLIAFSLQGFFSVWLPLEIALIFDRGRRRGSLPSTTRRAAGLLVVALQAGAIIGALGAAQAYRLFDGAMTATLVVPAVAVSLAFFAILFGVEESKPLPGRTLDSFGFVLLAFSLMTITSGLTFLKLSGAGAWWAWLLIAFGFALLVPFGRWVLGRKDPAIDLKVMRKPTMWPVQATAALVGVSLLGAQAPLATFAGTDPGTYGYGLGLDAGGRSILIGVYLLTLIVGASLLAILSRRVKPRLLLIVSAGLVGTGYSLLTLLHDEVWQVFLCMGVAGLGCGALVGALPAAAAAAAPLGQTGIAAGLTNTTKTIGGSFASSTFAIVLAAGAVGTAASMTGYISVWLVCGITAFAAMVLLFFVPKLAFADETAGPPATSSINELNLKI
ncbi:MFS transporter [Humidisolicoccus flavus]|uniref:MFS transporter n=1 Tax=Humidisolicoccus flavus TaxID=3111414 RepID=UPI003248CA5E